MLPKDMNARAPSRKTRWSPRRRSPHWARRGLTLVEVMATAAVLGIGMMALTKTYTHAREGSRGSRLRTAAVRIAEQRLERLSTLPVERIAGCVGPTTGCRVNRDALAPVLGNVESYRCTQAVDEMGFIDPAASTTGQFRVDTVVENHPDPRQQAGARVVYVSVCWTSLAGQVEQVQLQRMVVPEV